MANAARLKRAFVACTLGLAAGATPAAEPTVELPAAVQVQPLAVRDQNPLLRPFYVPSARLAPDEGISYSAALAWSNTTNLPHTAVEQLYVDAETAEIDLRATWRRGAWLAAAELPMLWRGGGILDGVIDDWHAFLGVNRGDRPYVQSNSYRITYTTLGAAPFSAQRGPALGDIPVEAGRILFSAPGTQLSVWAGAKLPTGSRAHATSNGALDAAAWLSAGHAFGSRFAMFAQAGVMRPGGSGEFAHVSREMGFGTLGVTWKGTDAISAIAQADVHSALPASTLNFLQPAVVGTFGARFRLAPFLALDVGLQEDLATNHSPDATLYFELRHAAGRY